MAARPKHALAVRERRWLVNPGAAAASLGSTPQHIRDRYLDRTRLRLRRVSGGDGRLAYKLCKKYGDRPTGDESITNLYLDSAEYAHLATLPGWQVDGCREPATDQ